MNWLLSIRHSCADPATAVSGTNVPYKLINKNGLSTIIEELKSRGANADNQSCSIPKPTASIEYMRSRISSISASDDISAYNEPAVNAWVGTLAVIVLSKRKNLFISEKNIAISPTAPTPLRKAVYDDFNALGLLDEDPQNGPCLKLFSIDQMTTSYPIAIADKNSLIFSPINRIKPALANHLGNFMDAVVKTIRNGDNVTQYTECVWKNISEWTDFSEDDRLYLASWIDGMLSNIVGKGMKCENALKALNNYLKSSVNDYISAVEAFGAGTGNGTNNYVLRWKSAWTYMALSKLYGENLVLESVNTLNVNTNPYVTNWLNSAFNIGNRTTEFMHVIVKYQGSPIIKFCPDVGLYLYESISNPQVWYHNGNWIDVFHADANIICPAFKSDLMWYINNAANGFQNGYTTSMALNKWAVSAPQVAPTDTTPAALTASGLAVKQLFDNLNDQEIAALGLNVAPGPHIVDLFNSVISMGVPVIFNKELVVFYDNEIDVTQSEIISLGIDGHPNMIKALWPITPEMANHIVTTGASLNFTGVNGEMHNGADNADDYITLNYTYALGNRSVLLSQKYKMSDICYLEGRVPYMTMWPYFLPSDAAYWKDYYVGLVNIENADTAAFNQFANEHRQLVDSWQRIEISGIKFVADPSLVKDQAISGADGNNFTWQVLRQDQFPRFIPLSGRLGGAGARTINIGCVAVVPPPATTINAAASATVGVDFGNSNTICAIAPSNGGNTTYSVIDNSDTVALLNGADEAGAYDSLSRCWVPKNAFSRKFLTAVQLFNSTEIMATDNKGISNGVVLFDNVDAIIKLYGNARSNNVMSGLKSGLDANQVDSSVKAAASVFLSEVLLLCKLQARKLGCGKVYYHFSYPKSQPRARDNLTQNLNGLTQYISDAGDITLYDNVFINEADAVREFVVSLFAPANTVGYSIVDIGGGTTDFSIWEGHENNVPTCRIESSLRFAGNTILTDSILRVFPQGTKSEQDAAVLRRTFAVQDGTQPAEWINKYVSYDIPDGMQEADEKYLRLILDNVINKTGQILTAPDPRSLRLRSHVHLKYLATFFAIAKSSEAKGKIKYPGSGCFCIYLAGGGSQCIDFASQAPGELNFLVTKMFEEYVFESGGAKPIIALIPPANGMSKLEVASGLLNHYRAADAAKAAGGIATPTATDGAAAAAQQAAQQAAAAAQQAAQQAAQAAIAAAAQQAAIERAQQFNPQILTDMYNEFVEWCLANHDADSPVYAEIQRLSLKNPANNTKFQMRCIPVANDLYNTDDPYLFICKAVSLMLDPRF